jgi:hypothetical protein
VKAFVEADFTKFGWGYYVFSELVRDLESLT